MVADRAEAMRLLSVYPVAVDKLPRAMSPALEDQLAEAVSELETLRSLARNDPDLRVRRRAIEHLTDSGLLRELLDDEAIAEAAAARLVALNPDISEQHPALLTAQLSHGHLPEPLTLDELAPQQLVELTLVVQPVWEQTRHP